MSEMVERVAKAIYESSRKDDSWSPEWSYISDSERNYFYDIAKAAIAEMREPTEEMFDNNWINKV